VVVAAIVIQAWPTAQAALEFDRPAVAAGQVWRLVTGQLVHFGWAHLTADLACFVALCMLSNRLGPGTGRAVVSSAGAVGAAVLLLAGDIAAYRGLSGIDYGLLAWMLAVRAFRAPGAAGRLWSAALLAVGVKVAIEAVTGANLFPTSLPGGVAVVSITHVAGMITGIALAAWSTLSVGDASDPADVAPARRRQQDWQTVPVDEPRGYRSSRIVWTSRSPGARRTWTQPSWAVER
jgi:rhomboid family GlyGly-CTERM serine protease